MIIGIGTDIVDVERIKKSILKKEFIEKIFSTNEINYCESKTNKAEHYAVRFAAKESFFKAIGTGYRGGVAFNEVEVVCDELGKPILNILGETFNKIVSYNIKTMHISLSHEKNMAIAMVILEK